jgi:hypothetical protein
MLRPYGKLASAFVLGLLFILPTEVPAEQDEAEAVQAEADSKPKAGFFAYSGGPVRGKRARTQTTATTFRESATWVSLPGATLSWVVPTGTTDLFNVAFSAECRLVNSVVPGDWVRIRILDNGVPMEPYDGQQAFCSANGYATHKGNWVRRVAAGVHNLVVQFWILDGIPFGALSAIIDDWTFELVVYD